MTVHLRVEKATAWLMGRWRTQRACSAQRDYSCPAQDRAGRHEISSCHSEQIQYKTFGLFISRIFHAIFVNCGWPWVTETTKRETMDKGRKLDYTTDSWPAASARLHMLPGNSNQVSLLFHSVALSNSHHSSAFDTPSPPYHYHQQLLLHSCMSNRWLLFLYFAEKTNLNVFM